VTDRVRTVARITAAAIVEYIAAAKSARGRGLRLRLETLLAALGGPATASADELLEEVGRALAAGGPDRMWLALAVLSGELPDQAAVRRACRTVALDGPQAALAAIVAGAGRAIPDDGGRRWPRVEVVADAVVVDLHHTARALFATGIQRVARESARRWQHDHDVILLGWTPGYTALRRLSPSDIERALYGAGTEGETISDGGDIVVPWHSTYVAPELPAEPGRVERFHALVRYSGNRSSVIGFDCVPMTTAETVEGGMGSAFAHYLSAVAQVDRLAAISEASAVEFRGWRAMLKGAGLTGPEITPVSLPVEVPPLTEDALRTARERLSVAGMPMVLVVGSHEPRKNHRAVLHAAELLWRERAQFSLLFVGGNSWNSASFLSGLHGLQALSRPVHALTALSDDLLWAAYRLARCTVFTSLNEGFGLPVAESLASGTPVITSNFGSMREIAEAGGVLLVDPRDDHAIAQALKRLLTDDDLHAELTRQANARPRRTWDQYAAEAWDYLVLGLPPDHAGD
jgi:glycosyltransferase involved in cell wall biosynthesis